MGKVQVVNALIGSLFVYKMMVLPSIPKNLVKCFDNQVREFLWNKKKAKIAYSILQNPKSQGGLALVNLTKKDTALKATWPQILYTEPDYAKLVYSIIRCNSLGHDIWRCNLAPQDIGCLRIKNQFWEDVMTSWSEYNYYNDFRVENQIIWYNSNIRIQGKPLLWKDIKQKGLMYVYQLFSCNKLKSYEELKQEFGITRLRYNSLVSTIPRHWKEFFTSNEAMTYHPMAPHNYDRCITIYKTNFSKIVYQYLGDDVMLIHNKYMKWMQELEEDPCNGLVDFGYQHSLTYKLTNVTKYRNFQYRLLQRGLVTNVHLYKWGLVDSSMCYFCKCENETISHLFFFCDIVKKLWHDLINYCVDQFKITVYSLSPAKMLMNQLVPKRNHVANFLCLVTKQYIYRQRCLSKDINFVGLKSIIIHVENMEKYIALKNNRFYVHLSKWRPQADDNIEEYVTQYLSGIE